MITEDMVAAEANFTRWAELVGKKSVKKIALLSPDPEQTKFFEKLFPDAWVIELSESAWNLDVQAPETYDIIFAASVFMAAKDPDVWFKNVLSACRSFWLQDHIRRWRGSGMECDPPTGDVMRYSYGDQRARVEHAYDLSKLGDRVRDFAAYAAGMGPENRESVSFVAMIDGELGKKKKALPSLLPTK